MNENKKVNFEKKIKEIEDIIDKIEKNKDLALDKSIELCEIGLKTISELEKTLKEAEEKLADIIEANKKN